MNERKNEKAISGLGDIKQLIGGSGNGEIVKQLIRKTAPTHRGGNSFFEVKFSLTSNQ
jgi:hypothetical protein